MNHSIESKGCLGNSFTNSYPDWREGTYDNFKEWSLKELGVKKDSGDDDDEAVPPHLQKAKHIEFARNDIGDFILPPLNNLKKVRDKQRVVRAYIGAVYSR